MDCGKGVWIRNMAKCVGDYEWQSVGGDAIVNLTDSGIPAMLSCAVCIEKDEEHADEGSGGETKAEDDERKCKP